MAPFKQPRMKSIYEQQIDRLIPDAVKHANKIILVIDPEYGPQIIKNSRNTPIRISSLKAAERVPYEKCVGTWNQLYHARMNQLTKTAGIR